MKKFRLFIPSLISILVLLLTSCAVKHESINIKENNAETILEKIQLYEGAIRSLKSLAKVKIKTPDSKISYTQVTIAQRPDLLRLEALNPFGKTVGFISSDGSNIYIISPSERGVYDLGEKFDLAYVYPGLKLQISAENLVNLILGRLPVNVYDMGAVPELSVDGERIKLVFHSETSIEQNTLWVNGMNFKVEKAEFTLDNGARAKINYEYFDSLIDGYYFPRIIEFSSEGFSISIIYEPDVELNKDVNKTLFKPAPEVVKFEK